MLTEIRDTRTNEISIISRQYRVMNGAAKLLVGRDRKVWLNYDEHENSTFLGRLPIGQKITRDNVCEFANTH